MREEWRPVKINWGFVKKTELENACEALMKEIITVQLSFKRCRELQMDKGREERHARKRDIDKGREL